MKLSSRAILFVAVIWLLAVLLSSEVWSQENPPSSTKEDTLRLEDLERMALENNPTIKQAAAGVRMAEGRKIQAGLYPNPLIGYLGEELAVRAIGKTSEHLLFLEQTIVTAKKLSKGRNVFAQEQVMAEVEQEAQKQRVLNTVRILFYETLGAQRLVTMRHELAKIARTAVTTTEELYNVGQADQPDVLEIESEAQLVALDTVKAENDWERSWQMLAAAVGRPELPRAHLSGRLEAEISELNQEAILARLLQESPQVKMAQAGIARGQALLQRAKAERAPDITLRGGFGYNNEELDALGGPVKLEGFVELGFPLKIFNRNQGNIAAAQAEITRAEQERRRLELILRAQMASAFRNYLTASQMVARYQKEILPRVQKAYELYRANFQQMAAAYPQVLITQRTLFQARADYIGALVDLWQNKILIEGLLLTGGLEAPGERMMDAEAMPRQQAMQDAGNVNEHD